MGTADFVDGAGRMARISGPPRGRRLEIIETQGTVEQAPVDVLEAPDALALATSPSGRVVALAGDTLMVLDQREGRMTRRGDVRLPLPPSQIIINPTGEHLWTGSQFVDLLKGQSMGPLRREGIVSVGAGRPAGAWISATDFAEVVLVPSGESSQSASGVRRALAIWRAGQSEAIRIVPAPEASFITLCVGAGLVVEAGTDKRIRVRESASLSTVHAFRAHDEDVLDIASHPTKPLVVTCSEDFTVKVWNILERRLLGEMNGFATVPSRVLFHPDGKGLAIVFAGNRVQIYRPAFLSE
jgi:WD40 repeat protein